MRLVLYYVKRVHYFEYIGRRKLKDHGKRYKSCYTIIFYNIKEYKILCAKCCQERILL